MFWMFVYFVLCYMAVGVAWMVVKRTLDKRKSVRRALGAALLMLPLVPYAAANVQTAIYGASMRADVRQALLDTGMSDGRFVLLRVLSINPIQSQVLVEEPCGEGVEGTVVSLRRLSGHWKLVDYDTAWSNCGSAEGNTFPPYPEAREF